MGVTNYEYTEIKRVHDEAGEVQGRYEFQNNKFKQGYNQRKEQLYTKKHLKKHF